MLESAPYSHFLFADGTLSLAQEHAPLWLKSSDIEIRSQINLNDDAVLAGLTNASINDFPNLWQKKKSASKGSASGLNKVLAGLLFILVCLWSVNHWLAYDNAKQSLAAVKATQQSLLKQALPNADTPDVYGRLKAEQASNTDTFQVLGKLNQALANEPAYKIQNLAIDLANKTVELSPPLNNTAPLTEQGFSVNNMDNITQLSWE